MYSSWTMDSAELTKFLDDLLPNVEVISIHQVRPRVYHTGHAGSGWEELERVRVVLRGTNIYIVNDIRNERHADNIMDWRFQTNLVGSLLNA